MRLLLWLLMSEIFVFGSNLKGIHGKGAAKYAVERYGAIRGVGVGPQGNAYAIPTKEHPYKSLDLHQIAKHIIDFKAYASKHPEHRFKLTAIGCGNAGYKPKQIAPMFHGAPSNIDMPEEFLEFVFLGGISTSDIVTREDGSVGPSIEHVFWMTR